MTRTLPVLLLSLSACLRVAASPPPAGPPPDRVATVCAHPDAGDADEPPFTGRLEGCFHRGSRADRDRFHGTVPGRGPQRVTLVIHRGSTFVGIRYDVADLGGRDLGSGFTRDDRRVVEFDAMGGAPFQIDLRTAAFGKEDEAYLVTMEAQPDTAGEPDDRVEDAVPLAASAPVTRRITGRVSLDGRIVGDLDHHRVEVARGGTLRIEATQVERARLRLALLDRDGRRVGAPELSGHGEDAVLVASVAPGTYVVRVEDVNGVPQATEERSYRLTAYVP